MTFCRWCEHMITFDDENGQWGLANLAVAESPGGPPCDQVYNEHEPALWRHRFGTQEIMYEVNTGG